MSDIETACNDVFRPVASFAHGKAVTYGGLRIVVASDIAAPIEEITSYVPEQSRAGGGPLWEISFCIDPQVERKIRDHCFGGGAPIQAKADLLYRMHLVASDTVAYASEFPPNNGAHVLLSRGRRICIVARQESEAAARTPLRVFREIVLRELENRGGILVHAAAVKLRDGGAVLIVGDARAGKTSTMCRLVLGGAAYISNDRCILTAGVDGIECIGWPFAIRLGIGFLNDSGLFSEGDTRMLRRTQEDAVVRSLAGELTASAAEWGSVQKLELTPREFCERLRCEHVESAPVRRVLFPQWTPEGSRIQTRHGRTAQTRATLERNVREPFDPDFLRGWMGLRSITDASIQKNCARILGALDAVHHVHVVGDPRGCPFPSDLFAPPSRSSASAT